MSPKVSVVIPTYNRAEKVGRSIESVLAQTFRDFEIIVVDDGSTDETGATLKRVFGDSIRYYFQANQGVSVARNKGIEEAKGEWIAFLDSDDLWEREKLDWQLEALHKFAPCSNACYTDVRFFNNTESRTMFELAEANYKHAEEIGINVDALRLLVKPGGAGMVVCLSSFMANRSVIKKCGGFDRRLLYSQDSEFMFRLAALTGFCYVKRPLVLFDRSPAEERHVGVSAEWNKLEFFLQDSQLRLEGLQAFASNQPRDVRMLIRKQLGSIHSGWVNCHLSKGDLARARAAAVRALRMDMRPGYLAKWLLVYVCPQLAFRAVQRRTNRRDEEFSV
jgi:glycosyltransferase involved in cell wall biosynthesis